MNKLYKIIILFVLSFLDSSLAAQVTANQLVNIHSFNNTTLMSMTAYTGCLAYNTTDSSLYVYNGSQWKKFENGKETTYETKTISGGNQTISVRNADRIIGFTLISSASNLSTTNGLMSNTWIINDDRSIIRCMMQSNEHPYFKFLAVSVKIDDATNTIALTNYTSRVWDYTAAVPQSGLTNNGTAYTLQKIVIIRDE